MSLEFLAQVIALSQPRHVSNLESLGGYIRTFEVIGVALRTIEDGRITPLGLSNAGHHCEGMPRNRLMR